MYIYIYTYTYVCLEMLVFLPVFVKKTFLRRRGHVGRYAVKRQIRGRVRFLLLDCRAKACTRGMFLLDTGSD